MRRLPQAEFSDLVRRVSEKDPSEVRALVNEFMVSGEILRVHRQPLALVLHCEKAERIPDLLQALDRESA